MNLALHQALSESRVARWDELLRVVPKHVLLHAVKKGDVVRLAPRLYALGGSDDARGVRSLVRRVEGFGALSHTSALSVWGLCDSAEDVVHLTVPRIVQLGASAGMLLHRRSGFQVGPPQTVTRDGLEVVKLERTIAESWPLIACPATRRAAVVNAVRARQTTADRLHGEVAGMPRLKGRASLLGLLELLRDGCHSELEIWGYRQIFDHPSLPPARRQHQVTLPTGRHVYLDLAYLAERVALELDGAEYHFSPAQRERDMRRDAALAQLGWLVVRFSHRRLTTDRDSVRAEVRTVLERRRHQLGVAASA